jgi:S1-C subfamily serine protease
MQMTTDLTRALQRVAGAVGPSVVRIGRHGGRGQGVVVGEGLVATNAHNLRDRTTQVTFADGRAEQGAALGADLDDDLVVLAVPTGDAPAVIFAPSPPELGTTVAGVAAGPGGLRVTVGTVSGTARSFRGPRGRQVHGAIEHTAPLARGSSGSPVADLEGRVVGLSTARLDDGFYLALPAGETLVTRIEALARGEERPRRLLGVGLAPAEVGRRLRAQVGLPSRDGLLVRTVAAGSPADRAGISVGDLLVAASGEVLVHADQLHRVIDALDPGAALTLTVVRGADELEVLVHLDADGAPSAEGSA